MQAVELELIADLTCVISIVSSVLFCLGFFYSETSFICVNLGVNKSKESFLCEEI